MLKHDRRRQGTDFVEPDLPITPMLDMSFQLLAFFPAQPHHISLHRFFARRHSPLPRFIRDCSESPNLRPFKLIEASD